MSLASNRGTRRQRNSRSIHVLVVDDSAVVRQVMTAVLSTERTITVDVASDPIIAMQRFSGSAPT